MTVDTVVTCVTKPSASLVLSGRSLSSQMSFQLPLPVIWISPNSWIAHRTRHGGKLSRPNNFLVARIVLTYFINKEICFLFLVINTKFACFLFDHVPTNRDLGRPSGEFSGHVGSLNRVIGRIWRLGDCVMFCTGITKTADAIIRSSCTSSIDAIFVHV